MPLSRTNPWHVRIAVKRDTVWLQFNNFRDRICHGSQRLFWKTVNQVEVDRCITNFSCLQHNPRNILFTLFTVDDKLYQRVEILNTQTQPSEAIGIQGFQMFPGGISRMSFERKFSTLTSCRSFQKPFDQVRQVFRSKKRWCASSQVNIPDNKVLTQLRFI